MSHLTSIRISDDEFDFCRKHSYKIIDIFRIGLANAKNQHLENMYEEQANLRKMLYNLEQKIYILENENIYKNKKIYTIDDVLADYVKYKRDRYDKYENLQWLEPKVKKLTESGEAYTPEQVYEFCVRHEYAKKDSGRKSKS